MGKDNKKKLTEKELHEIKEYIKATAKSALDIPDRLQDYIKNLTEDPYQPTLTGAVLNTLEILDNVGLWKEPKSKNSTAVIAVVAVDAYTKMLKRISQYRSAQKAASQAYDEWLASEKLLARNLVYKGLEPLKGTDSDPLNWYRPTSVLLKTYKSIAGKPLSQRVLNKYQAAGLIPPPIRIGRQAYRSFITLIFLNTIEWTKRQGIKLSDPRMKEQVYSLVNSYLSLPPSDKDTPSPPIQAMLGMINDHREAVARGWDGVLTNNKDKNGKRIKQKA